MDVFIKLDSLQYRNAISRLITEARADAKLLLREESRLLLRDISGLMPPQTQEQGRLAVKRDLLRAFRPLDPRKFEESGTPTGKRIAALIRSRDIGALNALFARMKGAMAGLRVLPLSNMQSAHRRLQNARGNIGRSAPGYPVLPQDFAGYLKSVQDRVGWAKAGWLRAAQAVGFSLPSYVTRHAMAAGAVSFFPAPKLGVTMTNYSSKIPEARLQAKIDYAIQVRYKSLVREAQRILAGGKSRRGSFAGTSTGAAMAEAA